MGVHRGLGTLTKLGTPWLSLVHCFNHIVELAIKVQTELYYLHEKSPKHLRELNTLGEVINKTVQKPSCTTGTRWISGHEKRFRKLESLYDPHSVSLKQTPKQKGGGNCKAFCVGGNKRNILSIWLYIQLFQLQLDSSVSVFNRINTILLTLIYIKWIPRDPSTIFLVNSFT